MDTVDQMVVPGSKSRGSGDARRRRRWLIAVAVLVILLGLAVAASLPVPYYSVAPGSALQVNHLIRVPKERAFPPNGKIMLATVALRRLTAPEMVAGWLDSDVDVVPEEQILGSTPRSHFSRQNRELMDDSKQLAAVVALRHMGVPVPEHGSGAQVMATEEGSPAHGRLRVGEVVTAVDGRPTALASHLVQSIRTHRPQDRVSLQVLDQQGNSRVEEVVVGTSRHRPGGYLGVYVRTKDQRFDFPFEVKIESGDIGGPSAGLAFTLGLVDSLTSGELTGGKKVAATGTVELDGSVGNVGGVAQKTAAVRAVGADYFLVPAGEYDEAVSRAGDDLEVIKASNVSEALAALARLGGEVSALGGPARPNS